MRLFHAFRDALVARIAFCQVESLAGLDKKCLAIVRGCLLCEVIIAGDRHVVPLPNPASSHYRRAFPACFIIVKGAAKLGVRLYDASDLRKTRVCKVEDIDFNLSDEETLSFGRNQPNMVLTAYTPPVPRLTRSFNRASSLPCVSLSPACGLIRAPASISASAAS